MIPRILRIYFIVYNVDLTTSDLNTRTINIFTNEISGNVSNGIPPCSVSEKNDNVLNVASAVKFVKLQFNFQLILLKDIHTKFFTQL